MRALALAALLGLAPAAATAGLCLLPLEGGGPVSEIEREQPWRIISGSGTVPGLPLVLTAPLHRARPDRQLYTVRGMRYEPLGAEFPRGALWVSQTAARPDGSVYGWELLGNRLFKLVEGGGVYRPVISSDNILSVAYDAGDDRLYLRDGDGLFEVEGGAAVPSTIGLPDLTIDPRWRPPRPGRSHEATLPRFVPPLGVHLSGDEAAGQLWLRTSDGAWRPLDHGAPVRQAWRVSEGRWQHDPAEGIVVLWVQDEALVLDARTPGDTRLLYRFTTLGGGIFRPDQPALVWEAAERPGFLARLIGVEPRPRGSGG